MIYGNSSIIPYEGNYDKIKQVGEVYRLEIFNCNSSSNKMYENAYQKIILLFYYFKK